VNKTEKLLRVTAFIACSHHQVNHLSSTTVSVL